MVVDNWINDPKERSLDHFIADAIDDGEKLSASTEIGAHRRRIERDLVRAINAGNLDPTKYRRKGFETTDPAKLSMEEEYRLA